MVGTLAHNDNVSISAGPRAVLEASDRFDLRRELGRGGNGIVFEVFDRERGERVALKLLRYSGTNAGARIEQEVQLCRELEHPNLVRMYDHGLLEGHVFCTMECVEGEDLLRYVAESSSVMFDEQRLRSSIAQLVDVLAALHNSYRVHRDVKPENVLVTSDGRVVLLDLGLAGELGELESPDSWVGTAAYIAPEQHRGERVGPAADFYAVGVVLHQMLTARFPAKQRTPTQHFNPGAPEDLSTLCDALLDPDPGERPQPARIHRMLGVDGDIPTRAGMRAPRGCFGREREQAELRSALAALSERGGWLHLQAPSGRGKTNLLDHVLREWGGATVFSACCDQSPWSAHGALDELILEAVSYARRRAPEALVAPQAEHACWLSQLCPAASAITGAAPGGPLPPVPDLLERRLRALEAMRTFFAHLAKVGPVVLWIDDAHLLPADALAALQAVWRTPGPTGLTLITSGTEACRLVDVPRTDWELAPMDADGVRELAGAFMHEAGVQGPVLSQGLSEPWQVLESARGMARGDRSFEDPAAALRARLADLSDDARALLELLCCARRHAAAYQHLLRALRVEENDLSRRIAQLESLGLVRRHDTPLGTDVRVESTAVRAAVLDGVTAEHRKWYASLWSQSARGHNDIPRHVEAAYLEDSGDRETAARMMRDAAAELGGRLAFGTAADLLEQAVELSTPEDGDSGRALYRALGDAQVLAGRNAEAAESYLKAAEGGYSAERVDLQQKRAILLFRAGKLAEAIVVAREVLGAVGLDLPETEQRAVPSLLWHKALLAMGGYRYKLRSEDELPPLAVAQSDALWQVGNMLRAADGVRGLELTTRATRLALKTGEPRHIARSLIRESYTNIVSGKPPFARAKRELALAREVMKEHSDPYLEAFADVSEGAMMTLAYHQPDKALACLLRADKGLADHCVNTLLDRPEAQQTILHVLALQMRLREVEAYLYQFVHQAQRRGDWLAEMDLRLNANFSVLCVANDDVDAARRVNDEIEAALPEKLIGLQHMMVQVNRGYVDWYDVDKDAVERFDAGIESISQALIVKSPLGQTVIGMARTPVLLRLVEASTGDERRSLLKAARKALTQLERSGYYAGKYTALRAWPLYHVLNGDLDGALSALKVAEEAYRKSKDPTVILRYLQGRLLGTPEGHATAVESIRWLKQCGVANVPRFLALWCSEELDRVVGPLPGAEEAME